MAEEKKGVAEAQQPPKSKKKLLIFAGILIGLILIGMGVAYYILTKQMKTEEKKLAEITETGKSEHKADKEEKKIVLVTLDSFIVNLRDEEESRYLKTTLTLQLSEKKTEEEVKELTPIIKDICVSYLSSKAVEEVGDEKGKNVLKDEITERINKVLTTGKVLKVFLQEFVVQ